MEKVTLWTRQDARSLEEYRQGRPIRIYGSHLQVKFEEVSEYVIRLYRWFVKQAELRVPKPEGVEFPVWCSVSDKNMLPPSEGTIGYVLEVDPDEIIYFDGTKWDYVLNHLYLPKDKEDEDQYLAELASRGHKDRFSFFDSATSHLYPAERRQVMDSWVRIFEIDQWDIYRVQANIWEIRPEMVKEIIQ